MEKLWYTIGRIVDFAETLMVVVLLIAFAFSIGHHLGYTAGLDTKVTWVGQRYIMKLAEGGKR